MGSRRNKSGISPLHALESVSWDWVALADIVQDERLQKRKEGLDAGHVKSLLGTLDDNGDIAEPVVLFRDEENILWLADGFHRVAAYKQAGRDKIRANIRTGSFVDAEVFAEDANLKHAKSLSVESRQAIFRSRVLRGFETNGIAWAKLSDGAIASELGVDRKTVGNWFDELIEEMTRENSLVATGENSPVILDRAVVFGRDGRQYELETIRVTNVKRAEDVRREKEAEEQRRRIEAEETRLAEQKVWPVIRKFEYLTEWLISVHNPRLMKEGRGLWIPDSDAAKAYAYYMQVVAVWQKDPSIRLNFDESKQWVAEFGGRPWTWFMGMVGDLGVDAYMQAKVENWDEGELEAYAREHPVKTSRLPLPGEKRAEDMPSQNADYKPATPRGVFPRAESPRNPVKSGRFAIGQMVYIKPEHRNASIVRAYWGGTEWKYILDHNLNVALGESELQAINEPRELDPNRAKFHLGDIVRIKATGEIDEIAVVIASDGYSYKLVEESEGQYPEDALMPFSEPPRTIETPAAPIAPPAVTKTAQRPNQGYADQRKAMYALWEISTACDQISQGYGKLLDITRDHLLDSLTLADLKDIKKRFDMVCIVGEVVAGEGTQRLADLHGVLSHFVETREIVDWFTSPELEGWTAEGTAENA